jgi:hypothetical protein
VIVPPSGTEAPELDDVPELEPEVLEPEDPPEPELELEPEPEPAPELPLLLPPDAPSTDPSFALATWPLLAPPLQASGAAVARAISATAIVLEAR